MKRLTPNQRKVLKVMKSGKLYRLHDILTEIVHDYYSDGFVKGFTQEPIDIKGLTYAGFHKKMSKLGWNLPNEGPNMFVALKGLIRKGYVTKSGKSYIKKRQ